MKIITFMHIFHETKADFDAIGHLKCMYLQIVAYLTCVAFKNVYHYKTWHMSIRYVPTGISFMLVYTD